MRTYIVAEWNESDIIRYHKISIDPDIKGGAYRQLVSIQTFQVRMMAHTQRWDGERFLGYRNTEERFTLQDSLAFNLAEREDGVPVINHINLWVFYKWIDYDHTKAKLKGKTLQR